MGANQALVRFLSRAPELVLVASWVVIVALSFSAFPSEGSCNAPATDETDSHVGTACGRVLVDGTQAPVPGAIVVLAVDGKSVWGEQNTIRVTTNEAGQFETAVPMGHGWFARPVLPPGYWKGFEFPHKFHLSPTAPRVSQDFHVHRGQVLNVQLERIDGDPLPELWVGIAQKEGDPLSNKMFSASARCDSQGRAQITIPEDGGDFLISCGNVGEFGKFEGTEVVTLTTDKDFCPDRMARVVPGRIAVVEDANGRKAKLTGARAAIVDGKLVVRLQVDGSDYLANGILAGRIFDETGRGIPGANVALAFVGDGGQFFISSERVHRVRANESGEFHITQVPSEHRVFDMTEVGLIIKKRGFIACTAGPFKISDQNTGQKQKARTYRMQRANRVRLHFVDSKDEAVDGALVKPVGDDVALRTLFVKTDSQGRCEFDELPRGYHKLLVSRGEVSEEVVVAVGTTLLETEVFVQVDLGQRVPPDTVRPIQPGMVAPEWDIAAWTDGKTRALTDLRGHVVVVDFWGVWCNGCRRLIPVLKELQRKYQDKGVVFVSIHTARTDVSQVKVVQQMESWESLSGIDGGTSVSGGVTAKRYGVRGFPSIIIVDVKGIVAYNDNTDKQLLAKQKEAAEALHLPWPIDAGADEEETLARAKKVNVYLLSKEIDAVLAK